MHEASLAFFQNFYTNVSLYVVADAAENAPQLPAAAPTPTAPLPVAVAADSGAAVAAPATATLQPPTPAAPAAPLPAPPVAVKPVAPAKLPSMAGLHLPPTPAVSAPASPASASPAPPVSAPPQRTAAPLTETPYSTLGSNASGLVILVRMDPERFRRLPKHVFLNNLLKAIRLIVEDVVLINVESHLPVALSTLRQKLAAKQIIGFGKNLLDVAVYKTQLYEPVLLVNDVAYLPAAEIELLEEDTGRKKLLWQAMQRMFLS